MPFVRSSSLHAVGGARAKVAGRRRLSPETPRPKLSRALLLKKPSKQDRDITRAALAPPEFASILVAAVDALYLLDHEIQALNNANEKHQTRDMFPRATATKYAELAALKTRPTAFEIQHELCKLAIAALV